MTATPEFSRPHGLARLGREGARLAIVATASERSALARRFGLIAVDRLEAQIVLAARADGTVRLEADMAADVVQACSVTLEPVPASIQDRFALLLVAADSVPDESDIAPEGEVLEPVTGDSVDLGEIVAQQLSLALDPYPRAPGAVLPAENLGESEIPPPMAALRNWGKKS